MREITTTSGAKETVGREKQLPGLPLIIRAINVHGTPVSHKPSHFQGISFSYSFSASSSDNNVPESSPWSRGPSPLFETIFSPLLAKCRGIRMTVEHRKGQYRTEKKNSER